MAQKRTNLDSETNIDGANVTEALETITGAADALQRAASRLSQATDTLLLGRQASEYAPGLPHNLLRQVSDVQVSTWENDPFSDTDLANLPQPGTPISVSVPVNATPLQTVIGGNAPGPRVYQVGSAEFRYWVAREAIARGINFWFPLLPSGTVFSTNSSPMKVTLEAGIDLNANYSRSFGLRFYQQTVNFVPIFSGESPDIVCHELGHSILDAVRPELFNTASIEVAAFHESFGDMSAILSAVQLPSMCKKVLEETSGRIAASSRLTRLAEQLGWAIRQDSPSDVDIDCLRNAHNSFMYVDPAHLPASAPAASLSAEPHSFSRVFTGAFIQALANIVDVNGPANEANLMAAATDLGQILADAVRLAPISFSYYSEVAATMIQADQSRSGGRYRAALTTAFVSHGILSPGSAVKLANAPVPFATPLGNNAADPARGFSEAALQPNAPMLSFGGKESTGYRASAMTAPELPLTEVTTDFGMAIHVHAPAEASKLSAWPASFAAASTAAQTPEHAALAFLEDLIQTGRLDFGQVANAPAALVAAHRAPNHKTHRLLKAADGTLVLKRLLISCGPRCVGSHQ